MPDEELDEQSLFDAAVSDEPEVQVADVAEVKTEPEIAEKTEVIAENQVEKPVVDDNAPQVPSWRVREINDEKRALADKLTALETERNQWLAERQRLTAAEKPPEKAAKPDPLLDPEGYEKYLEDKFEAKRLNDTREFDLRITRQSNIETFDKAYEESQRLKAARDPAFMELSQKMNSTNAPGKVLLDWYQDRMTKAEIGGDINAYNQRKREELLKDPEFRKAAMDAWRAEGQPQANGRPRVDLPPSLNGASRSNSMLRSTDGDVPDGDLWNEITA